MTAAERPILFSGEMVRAILDGRKTETRRPVKDAPGLAESWTHVVTSTNPDRDKAWLPVVGGALLWDRPYRSPCGLPGDLLYVRESAMCEGGDTTGPSDVLYLRYVADDTRATVPWPRRIKSPPILHKLANGTYKEACRIWLLNVSVTLERLQDITEAGAVAEGWQRDPSRSADPEVHRDAARDWYAGLWQAAYGGTPAKPGPYRWGANPWVWVVRFEVLSTTGRPADV